MDSSEHYRTLLTELARKDLISILNIEKELYPRDFISVPESPVLRYKLKPGSSAVSSEKEEAMSLEELEKKVSVCIKCSLHKTRNRTVFGKGSDKEKLVIIGEAPGADEDASGEPFVGRAGQLLTKMLEAIDIRREDVYICNVLKCRPPGNRDPLPDEIIKCSPYLDAQLRILQPKYILALGRIAAIRLLGKQSTMKEFREGSHSYNGVPVRVTYHPSALLRNPNWKRPAWEDLKKLKELLGGK